jgi:hypothetical protein
VAALVSTATATAGGDTYKLRATPAGQAAARAATLTMADIGSGWTGGSKKPDLSVGGGCANFHPKTSDIILTGAAATTYKQPGVMLESESQVMRTAKMVQLDWQRSVGSPHFLECVRSLYKKSSRPKARFVSVRRLEIPSIATYTAGFRVMIDVPAKAGKVRMVYDIVAVGRGNTEIILATTMPLASVPTLFPNEIVLARTLASRIRV